MKAIITVFLLFGSVIGFTQISEFKKIVSEKDQVDKELYFKNLQEFKEEYVKFAAAYFQLGNIELDIFSNLDPITERLESRQRIINVKVNYSLAKNFLDPKEIGRFPEWYDLEDIKDKDSLISLGQDKLDVAYSNTETYIKEYEKLILNYDKAVAYYLDARERFIEINNSAESLRQLFLEADEELKDKVKEVGNSFDSCQFHLSIYKDTYQLMPYHEKREVNVKLREIDHFRMNGITPVNFLADDISLWDYGSWSKRFLDLLKEEVDGLQEEIVSAYNQFSTSNEQMIFGDKCMQVALDDLKIQRIINLISKYDNESALADIFRYVIAKLEYGNQYIYERSCNAYSTSITDDLISRKARVYQSLFQKLLIADSLNASIRSSEENEATFMWFFDRMLEGPGGSSRFAENQAIENTNSFEQMIRELNVNRKNQYFLSDSSSDESYENQEGLLVLSEDSIIEKTWLQKKLPINDSLVLLLVEENEKQKLVGANPIELDFERLWEIAPTKNREINFFKNVGDSSFIVGGTKGETWMGLYTTSGTENLNLSLSKTDSIVDARYNQLLGKVEVLQAKDSTCIISTHLTTGKKLNEIAVKLSGAFAGSLNQGESTFIYSLDKSRSILHSQEINSDGEITNEIAYQFQNILVDPFIIKNDNQLITVIAKDKDDEEGLIYALLNYDGEVRYEKAL